MEGPTSRSKYPAGVPDKFSSEGEVQDYPGNTILCHLPDTSPLRPGLRSIYAGLSASPLYDRIVLLPPASWHMTVLDGICAYDQWSREESSERLDKFNSTTSPRLRELSHTMGWSDLAPPYKMRAVGFGLFHTGITLRVEGATVEEDKRIRRLRNRLSEGFGFRHPNHETYGLHVSIAYFLRHLGPQEEQALTDDLTKWLGESMCEFELGAPEFCTFQNMFAFERQFYF